MVLEHCSNCEGSHPAPLDEACPFPASEQPITRRVTCRTRTLSLSPPPLPKRGRGGRRGRGRGGKTAHQRDQSPAAPDAAQNQPDPPQSPNRPASRDPGMQPSVVLQPADCQAAAIQAIDARMQQDAKAFQEAAARDREADRQEMLRQTAAPQPTPGPSPQEPPQPRLPYPPADFRAPTRQPPPYPTQGYSASSALTATHTQRPPVPPPVQPTRLTGADLPDGEETFADFCPPQFAVPTQSIGEEQLRRAGLDPQLLQQVAEPASALRAAGKPNSPRSGASSPLHRWVKSEGF